MHHQTTSPRTYNIYVAIEKIQQTGPFVFSTDS